jgi:hypothetical protein
MMAWRVLAERVMAERVTVERTSVKRVAEDGVKERAEMFWRLVLSSGGVVGSVRTAAVTWMGAIWVTAPAMAMMRRKRVA